jgi:filamentous hemagglutinin family protein
LKKQDPTLAARFASLLLLVSLFRGLANPGGMTVSSGSATAATSGSTLTITAANNTWLDWQSFNIAANETTIFQQPSSSSIVWNTIGGSSASQIYGSLQANGVVVLINPAGFYFGPNSFVKAAGVVMSTASGGPVETGSGTAWQFTGPPPTASIVNYGRLTADAGGFVYLLSATIDNRGSITAAAGNIGLCAGETVLLSERADGRGLSAQVKLPTGSVNNSGQLVADAGTILASAQVVNQNGLIEANSVQSVNGIIELDASSSLTVGASSQITANGDAAASGSNGGQIMLQTGGTYADAAGSSIQFAGGVNGGDGGRVLIYAAQSAVQSTLVDTVQPGFTAGSKYFFPRAASLTLNNNSLAPFAGFSSILFQASGNITFAAGTAWDLAANSGGLLQLEAGGNITLPSGTSLQAQDGWEVTLEAGRNFSVPNQVTSGTGSILFSGTAGVQAGNGDITLLAGNNVTVNSGYVRTIDGGNISVAALAGSVNTGNNQNGYDFRPTDATGVDYVYVVDPDLGGISTAAGGNVDITAGKDITSYLPVAGGVETDAGTGCFGPDPGNVTLTAGRNVVGHYVVADGTGTITAGNNAGTTTTSLALSLVDGGWNVTAGNDILLQEVRNPNGIFNDFGSASSTTLHYFNYSADAYTILTAGNAVDLLGTALPRYPDSFDSSIPCIYPPTLEITAGAGGVTLGNDVILFPSAQGWLDITTTEGGSLTSSKSSSDLAQLILSDSGNSQYLQAGDFGISDHAATPIHIDDDRSVELNIAGDMEGIYLVSAEPAQVNVGGDMINCRFDGQNLHAGDVTSINVAGAIENRSDFTSVTLSAAPNFSALASAYPPLTGDVANLLSLFYYDAATKTLTFEGRMTTDEYEALLDLTVQKYDANGQPVLDASGNPVTVPARFISPSVLLALFNATQDIPSDPNSGFRLGGGGSFNLTAGSLDLGATAGIVSEGPAENAALANYFTRGANVNVDVTGDLNMFSTTISCVNGGNVSVTAGGNIILGSTYFTANDEFARGIFSTDDGNVSVVAGGDIDINGSRIAAYDGGNVTVESLYGDVNVGAGGAGSATVQEIYVDPLTRAIASYSVTIPGCGILATTFPKSLNPAFSTSENTVGNILVETPEGNITSTSAGIVQMPLNGSSAEAGSVTLIAGSEGNEGSGFYLGNIDVAGGGVIGANVTLKATGSIIGSIVARNNLTLSALQNVAVAAFAGGDVTVSAGQTVSGTLIGLDAINVTGGTIEAALLSDSVTASGNVTSSQVGFAPISVANTTSQGESADSTAKTGTTWGDSSGDDDERRRAGGAKAKLVSTGRVTALPPEK